MKKRRPLLYQVVYRTLRGRILSGDYAPGSRIETEHELTTQLKASIIIIRQAEQMLVDEGLLDKQQGRGTFVPKSVTRQLKILGVCGLDFQQGLQHRMGPYYSDLIVLCQDEAAKRGIDFETAWLPTGKPDRAHRFIDEAAIREYWGFVFFGCGVDHALLNRVRKLGQRYAVIASSDRVSEPRRVWLDYPAAIRLALEQFADKPHLPVLIMGIDNLRKDVAAVLKQVPLRATQVYLQGDEKQCRFETGGYQKMLEMIEAGQSVSRVLFLDDVVALGATRAMLQAGIRGKDTRLVIICGQQEIVPLGFPATFVAHDTQEEVKHVFSILEHKGDKLPADGIAWRSGFHVVGNDTL
jgi:DNA-binding LacI/PurR family transcriptional regulator